MFTPYYNIMPLDLVGNGSVGAWSLQRLSRVATNAIRVRRDNDNEEQDIGFVGRELDTVSLLSFVGSNSAYVTTWYDQSGNSNNATQTTADNQPRIVNAGVIEADSDGNISLKFDGVDDYLSLPGNGITGLTNFSIMGKFGMVGTKTVGHAFAIRQSGSTVVIQHGHNANDKMATYISDSDGVVINPQASNKPISTELLTYCTTVDYDNSYVKDYVNGSLDSSTTVNFTGNFEESKQAIGWNNRDSGYFGGKITDIIIFNKALAPNQVQRLSK